MFICVLRWYLRNLYILYKTLESNVVYICQLAYTCMFIYVLPKKSWCKINWLSNRLNILACLIKAILIFFALSMIYFPFLLININENNEISSTIFVVLLLLFVLKMRYSDMNFPIFWHYDFVWRLNFPGIINLIDGIYLQILCNRSENNNRFSKLITTFFNIAIL